MKLTEKEKDILELALFKLKEDCHILCKKSKINEEDSLEHRDNINSIIIKIWENQKWKAPLLHPQYGSNWKECIKNLYRIIS